MYYISEYKSPLGEILLSADDEGLAGLWFYGQKYFAANLNANHIEFENETITLTKKWLDLYFEAKNPEFQPPIHIIGSEFQITVWNALRKIPYGKCVTYKYIAENVAKEMGVNRMSAQAVGNAIGRNPVSIIIPCHRVISSNGKLTGYAGGIERKERLLKLEKCNHKV